LYKTSLFNESYAFLKSMNSWCTVSLYSHFLVLYHFHLNFFSGFQSSSLWNRFCYWCSHRGSMQCRWRGGGQAAGLNPDRQWSLFTSLWCSSGFETFPKTFIETAWLIGYSPHFMEPSSVFCSEERTNGQYPDPN
jgi:hypothetical protein